MSLVWFAVAAVLVATGASTALAEEAVQQEQPKPVGICAMEGCNCTVKAHHWIFVKCVFSDYQVNIASALFFLCIAFSLG